MTTENIYATEIKKTGFVLEHSISEILKANGWFVLNNRYYIDDVKSIVREIDIIAYKASILDDFRVYTTLVISCKKSENYVWALLSREKDENDPNIPRNPVLIWTNNKAVNYSIKETDWKKGYFSGTNDRGISTALAVPERDIFAFQEMKKSDGSPKNDKSIFDSITSLLKAQSFEIDSLNDRIVNSQIRQFNLISIVDTELIRLMFEGDSISETSIEQDHYLARYIINTQRTNAIIQITTAEYFQSLIEEYNLLHNYNCRYFEDLSSEFYKDAIEVYDKRILFWDEFCSKILSTLWLPLRKIRITLQKEDLRIDWDKSKAIIYIDKDFDFILINKNPDIMDNTSKILTAIYRYDGPFVYEYDEIPF